MNLAALAASVPNPVREVCRVLSGAGHRAYAVGGAVRDALLEREPGDWDVTTSALPEQVVGLFKRTIPTGIEHGTVTVMAGRGEERMAIEVTTFRGEGAYSDARRPDIVSFGVSLEEDLARRDFVVNAIAYDPIADVLEDPFGGAADIAARRLRAVGDARARFTEDGLRVMRAVRFMSTLEFELDPATEEALEFALPTLARVAAERVRVELWKLLEGPGAERALEVAWRRRVLATALPLFASVPRWEEAARRALALPADAPLRLAALLLDCETPAIDSAVRRLTVTNQERARIGNLVRVVAGLGEPATDAALRGALGSAGRELAGDVELVVRACGQLALAGRIKAILDARDPLVTGELAIGGADVMEILGISPGREIGEVLAAALEFVHADPSANTRTKLVEFVKNKR